MFDHDVVTKVEEAMKDEAFAQKLFETESAEDAQKLFADKGIEFTLEELKAIAACAQNEDGELQEEALENVSGGSHWSPASDIWRIIIRGPFPRRPSIPIGLPLPKWPKFGPIW